MLLDVNTTDRLKETSIVEVGQQVKISILLPHEFIIEGISNIDMAYEKITSLTPMIKKLADAAFIENDEQTWRVNQALMYYWNYRDLTRFNRTIDYTPLVEQGLRKILLKSQIDSLSEYKLECSDSFTPKKAIEELRERALSHRINHHPFLEELSEYGINQNRVKVFLENYYVNNRVFHLLIVALSLFSPLERRTELANNFYDEMGSGDSAMAHPVLFLKNFNTIGSPQFISPLAEALYLFNAKVYTAFLLGDCYYGMGGFGFIELSMPGQMKKILKGLEKSGLPRNDLEFWETHITIDIEHGKTWFHEMLDVIKTVDQAKKCLMGGMHLLDARAIMYDGFLKRNED